MRVHRSFAFVDILGFTALTEHEGDERAVEMLTAFRALLRDICGRRSVRIAKWMGDGAMLVGVETQPLLATILELHYVVGVVPGPAQNTPIRSGITSGDVILMEGDDYIGHAVNIAARLCDQGQVGEALADSSVMGDLPAWGVAVSHREVALRGVEHTVLAWSIAMREAGAHPSFDPICGLPLSEATAQETATDERGTVVLFCSVSCLDIWLQRPATSTASSSVG